MQAQSIPVIDIDDLTSPRTLAALDEACREWGFFQVVNHGIPADAIDRVLVEARAFFAKPAGFKRRIERTRENIWGFYDRELTKNVRDLKEVFDYGPPDGERLRPQWPESMPGFRDAVQAYYRHNERLAFRLLGAISVNLGLPAGFLGRDFATDHTSFLRLNYYPVAAGADDAGGERLGVGQHTDSGALTLLLQDDQPGLEVFRNDAWHLVEPRRDALVVNIGDMVQVWSNDRYFAALHRVTGSRASPRFSIPFFLSPAYRTDYRPVPTMVSADRPARYRQINWGEFRARRADGDYADLGEEIQIEQYRITA
jgi:isopenicillin N synthase-like dioxygenase